MSQKRTGESLGKDLRSKYNIALSVFKQVVELEKDPHLKRLYAEDIQTENKKSFEPQYQEFISIEGHDINLEEKLSDLRETLNDKLTSVLS